MKTKAVVQGKKQLNNKLIIEALKQNIPVGKIARKNGISAGALNLYLDKHKILDIMRKEEMEIETITENGVKITKYKCGYAAGAEPMPRYGDRY